MGSDLGLCLCSRATGMITPVVGVPYFEEPACQFFAKNEFVWGTPVCRVHREQQCGGE